MKRFTELYDALDRTTSTNAKIAALASYFREAPPADAAWATFFLTGRRLKRLVPSALLWAWTQELTGLPDWLLRECYSAAGDFAEVMALTLDTVAAGAPEPDLPLAAWAEDRILPLAAAEAAGQRAEVTRWWRGLPRAQRFVLNKLLTGEFRVGVAQPCCHAQPRRHRAECPGCIVAHEPVEALHGVDEFLDHLEDNAACWLHGAQ